MEMMESDADSDVVESEVTGSEFTESSDQVSTTSSVTTHSSCSEQKKKGKRKRSRAYSVRRQIGRKGKRRPTKETSPGDDGDATDSSLQSLQMPVDKPSTSSHAMEPHLEQSLVVDIDPDKSASERKSCIVMPNPKKTYKKKKHEVGMPRKSHKSLKLQDCVSRDVVALDSCEESDQPFDVSANYSGELQVLHVETEGDASLYDDAFYDAICIESLDIEFCAPSEETAVPEQKLLSDNEDDGDLSYEVPPVEELPTVDISTEEILREQVYLEEIPFSDDFILEPYEMEMEDTHYLKLSLLLLLSEGWTVDSYNGVLRLFLHSCNENVAVIKAITWKDGTAKIFVHNKPLPVDHFLWEVMKIQDPQNLGEVCDNLAKLANLLQCSNVCCGVENYRSLWKDSQDKGMGTIESDCYTGQKHYRSQNCPLVMIEDKVCKACHKELKRFKSNSSKQSRKKDFETDRSKINNKYLSRKELEEKAVDLQKKLRTKNKALKMLKKRVKAYIKSNSVNVSSDLSADLAKIFQAHHSEMSDAQRIFWSEQLKALSRQNNSRSMRWNPFVIRLALHLHMVSGSAYRYLKNFVVLPSERTLFDYTHFVEAKEGAQEEIIFEIKKKLETSLGPQHVSYHNLLFDEMHIRSNIVVSQSTGEVVGYVHLNKVEEEMAQLESELSGDKQYQPKPAKKVLVFMLQGVNTHVQEVVGIYPTDNLNASNLYLRIWDLIFKLEKSGLLVLCLVCDGASMNRKCFNMHASLDAVADFVFVTKNLVTGENRPLYFIVDPPHLLKTLRNCFANSFAHRKTRKLWKNNEEISWQAIEILYEVTLKQKYRDVKLTRSHVKLTAFSCMTVIYAAQVLSRSVAKALEGFINDKRFKGKITKELIKFIRYVNDFFDCLNGGDGDGKRILNNQLLVTYTELNDKRFDYLHEVLSFFKDWENDVMTRSGKYSKTSRERMFISRQSYEALQITIHSFIGAIKFLLAHNVGSIKARAFNQDKLEQYFGIMRMKGGANTNPTAQEFCSKSISLHVQGQMAQPPSKGNTQASRGLIVDETPLPKRRKKE